jgi:hypothetical protein
MAKTKIVDEAEARKWMEAGKPYSWMQQQYRDKYNIDTSYSMWGNLRRKWGYGLRMQHDDQLIPWKVEPQHRWAYPLAMLRAESRVRRGEELREQDARKLPAFLKKLEDENLVVMYEPRTEEGFWLVPREPEDTDIIRTPKRKTTNEWGVDEEPTQLSA